MPISLPPQLTTDRLHLRLPAVSDLDALSELYDDPLALSHLGTEAAWGRERTRSRLERWNAAYRQQGYTVYTVLQRPDDAVVGVCGLWPDEDTGAPEITCMISRRYWKSGYGLEACTAVLSQARTTSEGLTVTARTEASHAALPYVDQGLHSLGFVFVEESPHPQSGRMMRHYRWSRPTDSSPA